MIQLRMTAEGEARLSEAQSRLTQKDYELARALFAVERKGDATRAHEVTPPPIYQILAANLRNVTNREIIRDPLEEPVE